MAGGRADGIGGRTAIVAVLGVVVTAVAVAGDVPGPRRPVSAAEIARDPAYTSVFPGATAGWNGRRDRPSGEERPFHRRVDPRCTFKCPAEFEPGAPARASREFVAPASMERIARWYVRRMGREGWRLTSLGNTVSASRPPDELVMRRPGGMLQISPAVHRDDVYPVGAPRNPYLDQAFSGTARRTFYSVQLQSCRLCRPEPAPPRAPANPARGQVSRATTRPDS